VVLNLCSLKQLQDAEQNSCYKSPLDLEVIKVAVRKFSFDAV